MDTKPPDSYMAHLAWIIPSVIALIGIALDHLDWASMLFSKIWELFFVNIWYFWVVAAGYGLYRFVRLIQRFHNVTNKIIPTLITANADNLARVVKSAEMESKSRVSANDILSKRVNSLEPQVHEHIKRGLAELETKISELIRKEAHERINGINAINHRIDLEFERMNKIETSLPQQMREGLKEVETKLATQITALNKRVDKAELPPPLTLKEFGGLINSPAAHAPTPVEAMDTNKGLLGLGLANSIPRVPTPDELFSQAILDRKKDKKGT